MNLRVPIGHSSRLAASFCGILFLAFASTETTFAKLCWISDPRAGVLEAEVVAIVKQASGDFFEVQEVLLGDSKLGDIIELHDFKLATCQQYGPDLIEPIMPDTRILLFLVRKDAGWAITSYGHCYFWVHRLDRLDDLRKKASDAVALRNSWEAARDLPDQTERIKALWPFLWNNDYQFSKKTAEELRKNAPAAGDYVSSQFASLNRDQRAMIIREIGLFAGEPLHQVILTFLTDQQKQYEQFLKQPPPADPLNKKYHREITDTAIDTDGELFYGVEGLASFKDPGDMPYIRELAIWAAKHKMEQTCGAILRIFGANPDKANLPILGAMLTQFGGFTKELQAHSYFNGLGNLNVPETVPLLVKMLEDSFIRDSAHELLIEIVGTDLGTDPQAWLKWYNKRK
jgi:hypothetical protein